MMKNRFSLTNTLDVIDLFQVPMPGFNLGGRDSVSSLTGGFFSFLVYMTIIVYGAFKF